MNRYNEIFFLLFLAIVLGILLHTRFCYSQIPFERDEGEYAYAGSLLLHHNLPYREAYNMKFPGSYFMYAVLMKIGGETTSAVRIGICLIVLLTAFLVGLITWLLTQNTGAAAVAVVLFFALNDTMWCQGLMANTEHFVNLFAVSGILFLLLFFKRNRLSLLFISGMLLGTSVIMKQYGYPFCLFALILLAVQIYTWPIRNVIKTVAVFTTGGLLPMVVLITWILYNGLWGKFIFLTINYAYAYVGLGPGKIAGVIALGVTTCLLVLLWRFRNKSTRFALGWLVFSIIAFSTGLYFRPHYFILAFPAYAFAGAYLFYAVAKKTGFAPVQAVVALSVVSFFAVKHKDMFPGDVDSIYRANYRYEIFADMPEVAKRINTFIPAGDKLSMFSNEPELYFYAHHISASGYIYNCPLFERQPYAQQMTDEFIRQVGANSSKLFIYSTISLWPDNQPVFQRFKDWWQSYSQGYSLKAVYYISRQNTAVFKSENEIKADSTWQNAERLEFWMRKE